MSSANKRVVKPVQKPRKKPPTHNSKFPMTPCSTTNEIGLFSSPHLTYQLGRCFMGSVGEISTSTHDCIGVIKAIAPNGGFGMKFVRSSPRGSNNGPFYLEDDQFIPFCDIQKIVVRNVNPAEVQKEKSTVNEVTCDFDDPEPYLQHYFSPNDNAEAFSLISDEQFPPEAMFEINKQKYNVISSYRENLEGYTVPLDKTDPQFKAKEEYYAKVAKEIEDNKCLSSALEGSADDEADCEELRFSAVLQDGEQGRELKSTYIRTKRGGRGSSRATFSRECIEPHRHIEVKPLNSNLSMPLRDQSKSSSDSAMSKTLSDVPENDSPQLHESQNVNVSSFADKKISTSIEAVAKKEFKNGILDPDAPEFKPLGLINPFDRPPSLAGAVLNSVAYPQLMSNFALSSQSTLPNSETPAVPFNLPSSVPCIFPSQLTALRHPQMGFSQQFGVVSQPISASGPLPNQPIVAQSAVGSRGPRQGVPVGSCSKQRPMDQANPGSQQLPFSMFPPQGFPFVQTAPYPIGVPFNSTVAGNFHPSAIPGMHALAGAVSGPGQQSSVASQPTQPPSGQANHMQSCSQSITSSTQAQGAQLHAGYNSPFGSVQCPAGVAAYSQYPSGQLIGSQATPGPLGYYSQPVYQLPGLIPFPVQQVGVGNQPQLGPQLHNQGQQSLLPAQPLQLQAAQHQGTVQSVQQQPHHIFFASPYHLSPQQMLAQAMTMGVSHQGVQNAFNIPQNVQPHPIQLYIPQQPNNTG